MQLRKARSELFYAKIDACRTFFTGKSIHSSLSYLNPENPDWRTFTSSFFYSKNSSVFISERKKIKNGNKREDFYAIKTQDLGFFFTETTKGMWYLKKVASLCEKLGPVSTSLRAKFIKFSFRNLGNGEKDKNGRRWTPFSFDNENENSDRFY